jgi:glycosyltransferase involved in cell wall biosynthesis
MKICRIANSIFFLCNHLNEQIRATRDAGHSVHLIASLESDLESGKTELLNLPGISFHDINICREISIWDDFLALIKVCWVMFQQRYDIVHTVTSKGGLIGILAAVLTGVPVRAHTFAGQPWLTKTGFVRHVAIFCDWLVAKLAVRSYTDSRGQRQFLVESGVVATGGLHVLGPGSIAGVDCKRFSLDRFDRSEIRKSMGIAPSDLVVLFVGRVSREKGVIELLTAYNSLSETMTILPHLILAGPMEVGIQSLPVEVVNRLKECEQIHLVGYTEFPERYLAVSDVFCLPSYREGFGSVVIEAAAMRVPAVVSRIFGLSEAVTEGETGILVNLGDIDELVRSLRLMLENKILRDKLGLNAQKRARRLFEASMINALQIEEYTNVSLARFSV